VIISLQVIFALEFLILYAHVLDDFPLQFLKLMALVHGLITLYAHVFANEFKHLHLYVLSSFKLTSCIHISYFLS
jgi:hypothetical protein